MPSNPGAFTNTGTDRSRESGGDARLRQLQALMHKDDPTDAVRACDKFNRDYPESDTGWAMASQLAQRIGDPGSALRAIERALHIQPDRTEWLLQKARCLLALGRMGEARLLARNMSLDQVQSAGLSSMAGLLFSSLDLYQTAEELFQRAVGHEPGVGSHYYNLATAQRSLGKLELAESNLDTAIKLNPDDAEAMALRSGLRTQSRDNNHVQTLKRSLARTDQSPRQRVSLCFSLAKELEDLGDYPESFAYLKMGADCRRQHLRYDVQRDVQIMATVRKMYPGEVFADAGPGFINAAPIFVIGMPRTGTTLVERMLGSHSAVRAAGELSNFSLELVRLAGAIAGKRSLSGPDLVSLSTQIDFAQLGRAYTEGTREYAAGKAHFVDKMPMNFLYAGLIHLALPKARIIHLERDPMDTCYAVYKTLFENAYPYSYDLQELGQYFVAYTELMAHWHHVMPGVMHTIHYEELVSDHRRVTGSLLEYCNLSWEEQCAASHESGGSSDTASAAQVRRPVHQGSVGKWKHYRAELEPLAEVLRAALTTPGVNRESP